MPINNATFSMKTFKDKVNAANGHFTLNKSSLKALIAELGGDYDRNKGQDLRTLNRASLIEVQGIIWPQGEGTTISPWAGKKRKYKSALGYLVNTLFGLAEADALLVASYKTSWARQSLTKNMKFVSLSNAKEADLASSGGLSNRYASELCIPAGGLIGDWPLGHKYIFCGLMKTEKDGKLRSAGNIGRQGFGTNVYCFQRDALTPYMCTRDGEKTPKFGGEIAFPEDVPISYIKTYEAGLPKNGALWTPANWVDDVVVEEEDEDDDI